MAVFTSEAIRKRAELMLLAIDGDRSAYDQLLREISPLLKGYLKKRLGSDDGLEDLLQQILLRIHLYRNTFSGSHSFDAWMFTIAKNAMFDFFRAKKLERHLSYDNLFDGVEEAPMQEAVMVMKQTLGQLSEESLRALARGKQEGLDARAAAKAEDISEAAFKVRLHRAMKVLKNNLLREKE